MNNSIQPLVKYANDKDITIEVITKQWNYLNNFSKEILLEKGFGDNGDTQQYVASDEIKRYEDLTKDRLIYSIIEWSLSCEKDKGYKLWESINPLLEVEYGCSECTTDTNYHINEGCCKCCSFCLQCGECIEDHTYCDEDD